MRFLPVEWTIVLALAAAVVTQGPPPARRMPPPGVKATSGSTVPVSPVAVVTWVTRFGNDGVHHLELLVVWRGTERWYSRGTRRQSSGGGTATTHRSSARYGDIEVEVAFDFESRVAQVQGKRVEMKDANVLLVDQIDSPGGPHVTGTVRIGPAVPPFTGIIPFDELLRRSPQVVDFLRCDLAAPHERMCALVLAKQPDNAQKPTPREIDDPEAYAVYATVLSQQPRFATATRLVLRRETATQNECIPSGGRMENEWLPVVQSYKAANARERFVLPERPLNRPYVVVPRADFRAVFKAARDQAGWDAFYERYPGSEGYIEVSAVGFDPTKTRALVYIAHDCGNLCGGGAHHLLEKVQGVWRPARFGDVTMCMWSS